MQINSPLFALTSDTDWASDACIDDLADVAAEFGIRPVFMATNESPTLTRRQVAGTIEIGLHPNFFPGSDHGATVQEVIDHIGALFPQAKTFRSHGFMDGSPIQLAMLKRGIRYDSNLSLYLQRDIVPLAHASGLLRLPAFWTDDVHWLRTDSWELTDELFAQFLTPGLKILDVHPFSFALNLPSAEAYRTNKSRLKTLTAADVVATRHRGHGVRTFIRELLKRLRSAGHRFYTLAEIYQLCGDAPKAAPADHGRMTTHTESEHADYWKADNQSRQAFLKNAYTKRNATDPYATSRDYNARELEIEAIARHLPDGDILDLGCGNGYTLVSLARRKTNSRMTGIDFSDHLITGAKQLAESLDHPPAFICGDAVAHIAATPAESLDGIITERFLLNLPDQATQHAVLKDIARCLRKNGRLLMCEGSRSGFHALNALRAAVGLEIVAETSSDNVSAIRFDDAEIEAFLRDVVGLQLEDKLGFSTFFAISRALHPKLVAPQRPQFSAKINDIAREIQMAVPFAPGIGTNTLWVFRKV